MSLRGGTMPAYVRPSFASLGEITNAVTWWTTGRVEPHRDFHEQRFENSATLIQRGAVKFLV